MYDNTLKISVNLKSPAIVADNLFECYHALLLRMGYHVLYTDTGACYMIKDGVTVVLNANSDIAYIFDATQPKSLITDVMHDMSRVYYITLTTTCRIHSALNVIDTGVLPAGDMLSEMLPDDTMYGVDTPRREVSIQGDKLCLHHMTASVRTFVNKLRSCDHESKCAVTSFGAYAFIWSNADCPIIIDHEYGFVGYRVSEYSRLPAELKCVLQTALITCCEQSEG